MNMQWASASCINLSLDGAMDGRSEKTKCEFFENSPKKSSLYSFISKDQKHKMYLRNTFPTFQYVFEAGLLLIRYVMDTIITIFKQYFAFTD